MKKKTYVLIYGITASISAVVRLFVSEVPGSSVLITLGSLSLLPLAMLGASAFLAKGFVNKINGAKVADMHGYMLRHRKEAEETSKTLLRKLQRIRRFTVAYSLLVCCLTLCAPVCGWLLYPVAPWVIFPTVFYAGTIFCVLYTRIPKRNPIMLRPKALVMKKEDYPRIHEIATRAARKLGCAGDITILLSFDCNASIIRDGLLKYYLHLGARLLNVLSEEELYCICIHEFSHCSRENRAIDRENRYGAWLSTEQPLPRFMGFLLRLFAVWDVLYSFHHMTYRYAISVYLETRADLDMAKHCDPAVACSALLKLNYDNFYEWESGVENEPSPYESETPNPHYLKEHLEKFKAKAANRCEEWNVLAEREILSNNATHPTLRMRCETLGVEQIKTVESDSSDVFRIEAAKALETADKRLAEETGFYDENRKRYYVEPMKKITAWEESGKPLQAETYADILYALEAVGRHRDAEELCELAIRDLDENSSHTAYFIKGCTMLHRYDPEGADYVFRAIELNHNYLNEGLDHIGYFYCLTGMEKELIEYRERAAELVQQEKDEFSKIGFLSTKDHLVKDDMPEEMREEIVSYILSVDQEIIREIYLVRKIVTESFFTSAFVTRFDGGTEEQKDEIMHNIFCYLDTYPEDWQFSLFDFENYTQVHIEKIQGTLVFRREAEA